MWDVDYLSTDQVLGETLVYLYRPTSGILIHPMRQALKSAAESQGYQLAMCDDEAAHIAVLGASSLFGTPYAIWHVEPKSRIDDEIAKRVLGVMAAGKASRFALFLPEKSALTRRRLWLQVEKACFVVRERSINRDNLIPALRYLERTTLLAKDLQLSSQQDFIDSFDDLLQEEKPEMVDLRREFNARVVIYTDLEEHLFDSEAFKRDVSEERRLYSLDQAVRYLLSSSSDLYVSELIASFDWFYWNKKWNSVKLLNKMYGLCCRELRNVRLHRANWNPKRRRKGVAYDLADYEMADRYILWSAIVLAWESRFIEISSDATFGLRRSSDLSITKLYHIARDFLTRSSETTRKDRLSGLWESLDLTLSRVGVSELSLHTANRERLAHLSESDLVGLVCKWQEVNVMRYRLICELIETLEFMPVDRISRYWLYRLKYLLDQAKLKGTSSVDA